MDSPWIPVPSADAAAVDARDIKTLLANGLSIFFINGKPVFSNSARNQDWFW